MLGDGLQETSFGERKARVVGHDDVIEQGDVDQLQCAAQGGSELAVGCAGGGHTRRMVVRNDQRAGTCFDCATSNFSRIDHGLRNASLEQFLRANQAVLAVEEKRRKTFPGSFPQPQRQKISKLGR